MHPFDHPDQYFSYTKGAWDFTDKRTIALTSQSDTVIYPLTVVTKVTARNKELSHFAFYDSFGDTVKILYVQFTDSSIAALLHRSMDFFTEDLAKRDTLEFHFYGYRPYLFIGGTKNNNDYSITLKAEFQPNFFNETKFQVKRNRLFDVSRHGKFIRQ